MHPRLRSSGTDIEAAVETGSKKAEPAGGFEISATPTRHDEDLRARRRVFRPPENELPRDRKHVSRRIDPRGRLYDRFAHHLAGRLRGRSAAAVVHPLSQRPSAPALVFFGLRDVPQSLDDAGPIEGLAIPAHHLGALAEELFRKTRPKRSHRLHRALL